MVVTSFGPRHTYLEIRTIYFQHMHLEFPNKLDSLQSLDIQL